MSQTYASGTTVRLTGSFKDFNGNKVDPPVVKLKIYDYKHKLLTEISPTRSGVGEYIAYYTTPEEAQTLVYEWYGEIDGLPYINRGILPTKFV